jgi:hypothetical protein
MKVHPSDSIRDTRPILEDSIRDALRQMSDEELRDVCQWANSWTQNHVSAVKRWVARGPINDEIERRQQILHDAPSDTPSAVVGRARIVLSASAGSKQRGKCSVLLLNLP